MKHPNFWLGLLLAVSLWPIWLCLLLAVNFFSPWSHFFYPSAWANVPFQADVKGAAAQVSFHVPLAKTYAFFLDLYYRSGDRQEQERVGQQVDSWAHLPDGQPVRRAPALPVHLTVSRLNMGESIVLDRTFTQHRLWGHGVDHYSEIITFAHLEAGHYKVRIETLEDVAALKDIPVHFEVGVPNFPK